MPGSSSPHTSKKKEDERESSGERWQLTAVSIGGDSGERRRRENRRRCSTCLVPGPGRIPSRRSSETERDDAKAELVQGEEQEEGHPTQSTRQGPPHPQREEVLSRLLSKLVELGVEA